MLVWKRGLSLPPPPRSKYKVIKFCYEIIQSQVRCTFTSAHFDIYKTGYLSL